MPTFCLLSDNIPRPMCQATARLSRTTSAPHESPKIAKSLRIGLPPDPPERLYARNARRHSTADLDKIAAFIGKLGMDDAGADGIKRSMGPGPTWSAGPG